MCAYIIACAYRCMCAHMIVCVCRRMCAYNRVWLWVHVCLPIWRNCQQNGKVLLLACVCVPPCMHACMHALLWKTCKTDMDMRLLVCVSVCPCVCVCVCVCLHGNALSEKMIVETHIACMSVSMYDIHAHIQTRIKISSLAMSEFKYSNNQIPTFHTFKQAGAWCTNSNSIIFKYPKHSKQTVGWCMLPTEIKVRERAATWRPEWL